MDALQSCTVSRTGHDLSSAFSARSVFSPKQERPMRRPAEASETKHLSDEPRIPAEFIPKKLSAAVTVGGKGTTKRVFVSTFQTLSTESSGGTKWSN
jgi:hypothetical protein